MPFISQSSVTIYFSNPFQPSQSPPPAEGLGQEIQVVESLDNLQRTFTLKAPGQADTLLTPQESDRLLELCSQINVSAPWKGQMGFDGAASTLTLRGVMSEMAFSWWGNAPAEWQSVGALFDYVLTLAT